MRPAWLNPKPDAAVVWVEIEPMLLQRRKVKIGLEQDGRLQVREGDAVYLVERTDGIEVRVVDPEFERQAAALREGMAKYRNAMRELAK